jgi:hypothetical protein
MRLRPARVSVFLLRRNPLGLYVRCQQSIRLLTMGAGHFQVGSDTA